MIFCARATHGLRRMGRVAWPSSCASNAHDQNVLVRRAQSRINQATLENKIENWDQAYSGKDCLTNLRFTNSTQPNLIQPTTS